MSIHFYLIENTELSKYLHARKKNFVVELAGIAVFGPPARGCSDDFRLLEDVGAVVGERSCHRCGDALERKNDVVLSARQKRSLIDALDWTELHFADTS